MKGLLSVFFQMFEHMFNFVWSMNHEQVLKVWGHLGKTGKTSNPCLDGTY